MNWIIILQAGIATGTVLLFATLGEILAEGSGVLNLGIEGMMLLGAMTAFKVAISSGNPWLGLLYAALAAGLLALLHAIVTVNFQADQVVSGLVLQLGILQPGLVRGSGGRLPLERGCELGRRIAAHRVLCCRFRRAGPC